MAATDIRQLSDVPEELGTVNHNLGAVWLEKNEPNIALKYLREALNIRIRLLGIGGGL